MAASKSSVVCRTCGLGVSSIKGGWRHNTNGQMGRSRCQKLVPVPRAEHEAMLNQAAKDARNALANRVDTRPGPVEQQMLDEGPECPRCLRSKCACGS